MLGGESMAEKLGVVQRRGGERVLSRISISRINSIPPVRTKRVNGGPYKGVAHFRHEKFFFCWFACTSYSQDNLCCIKTIFLYLVCVLTKE